jgi:hypothetical protein
MENEENINETGESFVFEVVDYIEESVNNQSKKRGKYFNSYTEEDVEIAIKEIEGNKMTAYTAAKKFHIPKTTLLNRFKGKFSSQHGKLQILSPEVEQEVVEWLIRCSKMGDPRTKDDLMKAVSELAKFSPDEHNRFKNDFPSSFWLQSFMKRHPEVKFRKPSTLSKASATVSKSNIMHFFNTFVAWLDENNFRHVFADPKQVGNGDETGFLLSPVPQRVLAAKGQKQVYRQATADPKAQVSVMFNFLASGDFLPPQLILKNSVNAVKVAQGAGEIEYYISQTENGWQTKDSFFDYVKKDFVKQLDKLGVIRRPDYPFFYLLDGHVSHTSFELYKWCFENNIYIIKFFPNATHILQMADVAMNGPGKSAYMKEVQNWKREKAEDDHQPLNHCDFVKILKKATDKVMKPEAIQKGFKVTGICPLDVRNLQLDRCIGAENINGK